MTHMLDCDIVVSEFELQSCCKVHFQANSLWKCVNFLTYPDHGLISTTCVLLQGWIWHLITYAGWHAIKQKTNQTWLATIPTNSFCFFLVLDKTHERSKFFPHRLRLCCGFIEINSIKCYLILLSGVIGFKLCIFFRWMFRLCIINLGFRCAYLFFSHWTFPGTGLFFIHFLPLSVKERKT